MPRNMTTTLPQPAVERALWRMVGAHMEARRITASDIEPRVDVSRSQIDRYIQGVRTAPFAIADQIVRELGWDSLAHAMTEARALEAEQSLKRPESDAPAGFIAGNGDMAGR